MSKGANMGRSEPANKISLFVADFLFVMVVLITVGGTPVLLRFLEGL